jgi:hypothetical protein
MIEPNDPPAASLRISASTASVPFASPPEKMTMRLPLNVDCTTWRMRSDSVAIGILGLVVDLARFVLLDVRRRRLDLDDVRAELRRDLRRVGDDVDRRLALLGNCCRAGSSRTTTTRPAPSPRS